jgi:C-terminal processing protease CtpA/Prc
MGPFDPGLEAVVNEARTALRSASGAVIDLRPAADSFWPPADFLDRVLPAILKRPLALPESRFVYRAGYPSQTRLSSSGFIAASMTNASLQLTPSPNAHPIPPAFIVNNVTTIPMSVLAMQKGGRAYLVVEGDPRSVSFAPTERVKFDDKIEVRFSSGELIFPDGTTGSGADSVVGKSSAAGPGSPAVRAALRLLTSGQVPGRAIRWRRVGAQPSSTPDRAYAEMLFPQLPWRRLAVIRLWSVVDAFFPYKALMDTPWDDALTEFLGRVERTTDATDYLLTMAQMAARLQDNHVLVEGNVLTQFFGEAALPVRMAIIEGKVVIEEVIDTALAQGLARWDEVLEIDDEPARAAADRLSAYFSSANEWTRLRNVMWRAMGRGADGTLVTMTARTSTGETRRVGLRRSTRFARTRRAPRAGPIIQVLPGNIGYVDLDRLELGQVEQLFREVADTKALILDMRGYPHATAWAIAPRLNVKKGRSGPRFFYNVVSGDTPDLRLVTFIDPVPDPGSVPVYHGRVVMLINEQTQSQAEHSGLLFEAASDIKFVGTPCAGSNGDITDLILPGKLAVSFTGMGVSHSDGRQLQRVGLQPEIIVAPTLDGLRAGKDEVLQRAIEFVEAE